MSPQKERPDGLPEFTETSRLRTKAGRLRDLFDEIQGAQAAGYRLDAIVEGLRTQKLEISVDSLKTSMKRIRHARKSMPATSIAATTPKKGGIQEPTNAADKPGSENPTSTEAHGGFSKEGYRQPLQTFTRDVTKQRNWD